MCSFKTSDSESLDSEADEELPTGWKATAGDGAYLNCDGEEWTFALESESERYCNAQIDDYRDLKRKHFMNRGGLRLEAEICWECERPVGTSGIGFWNDPFMMTGWRWPSLPKVAWFLLSGNDSEMRVGHAKGFGLKAQVIDAWSLGFFLRLPLMVLGPIFGRFMARDFFLGLFSKSIGLSEKELSHRPQEWKRYSLEWGDRGVRFSVDGEEVMWHPRPLKGKLGMVIWQDNQWMKFDPRKGASWGVSSPLENQTMRVRNLSLKRV